MVERWWWWEFWSLWHLLPSRHLRIVWHLHLWHFWHDWFRIGIDIEFERNWGIRNVSANVILSWHPETVSISSEIVLLGILLELNGIIHLLHHIIDVFINTSFEFIIGVVLLNSGWVV